MRLGNHIDIIMSTDTDQGRTTIKYNGAVIGGIQSVKFEASADAFGDHIDKFAIIMWDPSENYVDDEQMRLKQAFIAEARRCGADIHLSSVLDMEDETTAPPDSTEIAKLALACATIAGFGLAALFGSKNKKQKVQAKLVHSSSTKKQYSAVSKKR